MQIKQIALAAFSPTGGTWKALRFLAAGFNLPKTEYDYSRVSARPVSLTCSADQLVIFAFPVFGGLMPKLAGHIFQSMHGNDTPAVLMAVYGNREYEGAFLDLEKLSRERGFKPVAAVAAVAEHSMFPDIAARRPDDADRKLLMDFGRTIEQYILEKPLNDCDFRAPGEYHKRPPSDPSISEVSADDTCLLCGTCVDFCPVGAIDDNHPNMTGANCIRCMACVKVCPVNSRGMHNPAVEKLHQWIKNAASIRKEAELFF